MSAADCIESVHIDRLPCDLNKHFHEEFTVTCILDGECSLWVKNSLIYLQKGDVVLMPANVVHSCLPSRNSDPSYKVHIITEDNPAHVYLLSITGDYRIVHEKFPAEDGGCVRSILSGIRMFPSINNSGSEFCQEEEGALKLAAEYICREWSNDIRLDDIAEVSGLSKYHLVSRFKNRFGITPHAYCVNVRINMGRKLLKTDIPIVDISLNLGFYDQSHFTNTFLKYTGTTPLEYRKKIMQTAIFSNTSG